MLTLLLGYLLMVPHVCGVYHDDGIYVVLAKAIAQGDGYHILNLPQTPLQTKYPFIFPALLSVIWKIWPTFPSNIIAMQWLTLLFTGMFVGLSYLYLTTFGYSLRPVAFLTGVLTATSSVFLYYGLIPLSEMPFACFMVIAMFALERHISTPFKGWLGQLILGILLALPYLTRAIGIVFIPSALVIILLRKRPLFYTTAGIAFTTLPWILFSILSSNSNESIVTGWYTRAYLKNNVTG